VKKDEKGSVEKTSKASDKLKSDIEKEKEDQKTKKKNDEASGSVVLNNNRFAVVKKAGGLQTKTQIQDKTNKQKGQQRNEQNNFIQQEKQDKEGVKPRIPLQPSKPKKPKPPKKLSQSDSQVDPSPSGSDISPSIGVNPQPVLLGAFVFAMLMLSYVFLLS